GQSGHLFLVFSLFHEKAVDGHPVKPCSERRTLLELMDGFKRLQEDILGDIIRVRGVPRESAGKQPDLLPLLLHKHSGCIRVSVAELFYQFRFLHGLRVFAVFICWMHHPLKGLQQITPKDRGISNNPGCACDGQLIS
ncbi:MAG: hypothetical protein R6U28_01505, partial [Cyclonatronaceae bacterium]